MHCRYSPIYLVSSSFDSCVHIWSFDGKKQGSLILGLDRNWKLKFNIEMRENEAVEEAKMLLD